MIRFVSKYRVSRPTRHPPSDLRMSQVGGTLALNEGGRVLKVKKWWAVVAGAVLGTAAVGTGAYVAKHRKRRKKSPRGAEKAIGEKLRTTPLDAVPQAPEPAGRDERG